MQLQHVEPSPVLICLSTPCACSAGLLHQLMELGGPGASVEGCEHPVPALEGDFSLNAANVLSADLLLRSGLGCVGAGLRGMC